MARRTTALVDDMNSVGISAAARVLGASRVSVYAWIRSGQLVAYPRAGTRAPTTGAETLRVLRTDLERLRKRRARA